MNIPETIKELVESRWILNIQKQKQVQELSSIPKSIHITDSVDYQEK
jgi:hypothetical protein